MLWKQAGLAQGQRFSSSSDREQAGLGISVASNVFWEHDSIPQTRAAGPNWDKMREVVHMAPGVAQHSEDGSY